MQFQGKKGLILGVANDHSIAWAIAQQIMNAGGECGFTHLPDREDDERQRNRRRVVEPPARRNPAGDRAAIGRHLHHSAQQKAAQHVDRQSAPRQSVAGAGGDE